MLLDQGKLVCGVGNWVADEVLYQAGVLPCSLVIPPRDEVLYQAGVLPSAACNTQSDLTLTPSRSLNRAYP